MRVSFDARNVGLPGIGRFILGLWSGLTALDADVVGIWPGRDGQNWLGAHHAGPAGHHVRVGARPFLPVEQAAVPWVLRRIHADVHHATHFNLPYVTSVPIVLTVHDLIAYLDPSKARSRAAGAYYRTAYPRAVRRADAIVAVSPFTARQLTEALGVPESRIRVIEAGIDHEHWWPRDAEEIATVRRRFALPEDYLLYVGTAKPHKNLATLFAAHRPAHPPLVIAGATPAEVDALGIPAAPVDRRIVLGRMPEDALPALYSGARALVLPSLHEGFGLTPLEAMACGIPVVVSDGGALPDTVGDAAIVLPARDVGAWTDALTTVCADDDVRARLVAAGSAHTSARRWTDAAEQYLDVYRSVAA
ncbi:MAG TPA: glycosyltransferase family 1 protein [Acidimicrobiia bacterium]|jgi:alpha-1,3-rhamnosyl/mannosyltransferase|nr:glycosyltransferase family 1 protein [Acidimicrobiia bacterium]